MKTIGEITNKIKRPIKIIQFGEGNFLRAFVDQMVDICNKESEFNGNIQIVKPIEYGNLDAFRAQNCVYTVLLRGKADGEIKTEARIVTSIAGAVDPYQDYAAYAELARSPELQFVVSNTTEAGIIFDETDALSMTPPKSFPGKLTKFLYERFLAFDGARDKGLIMLPVELIDKNGATLKDCCLKLAELWALPTEFSEWISACNLFCNTLVDRIVTGFPKNEVDAIYESFGYADKLLVTGELFGLWVIESDDPERVQKAFPLDACGLPVLFTRDLTPFRERKVRLLNGTHTATVFAAILSGVETVGEAMADKDLRPYIDRALYEELSPMVPLPADEVRAFANAVCERFENPYNRHEWQSIALNSVSKFRVRVFPTIVETEQKTGKLPKFLSFSLAALICYYAENPSPDALEGFENEFFSVPGLKEAVNGYMTEIREYGARATIVRLLNE